MCILCLLKLIMVLLREFNFIVNICILCLVVLCVVLVGLGLVVV